MKKKESVRMINNVLSTDKKIIYTLTFLGHKETESKKEPGKFFYSASFNDEDLNETMSFNFKADLLPAIRELKKYIPVKAVLKVGVYNGQAYLQFVGIEK
jgi:hypothetical protein